MPDLSSAFNRLSPLTPEATTSLQTLVHTKSFPKNSLLLKQGEICRKIWFIDEGLAKTFFYKSVKEFIMRFFPEHSLFTVVDSFTNQTPSAYEVMALEDTTVTYLTQTDLESLSKEHHCIETVYRKLLSFATTNMMKRISEMLEENATERYNHFLEDHGHLLQRISLGDLSSYLGITQVSLSRIRAKK